LIVDLLVVVTGDLDLVVGLHCCWLVILVGVTFVILVGCVWLFSFPIAQLDYTTPHPFTRYLHFTAFCVYLHTLHTLHTLLVWFPTVTLVGSFGLLVVGYLVILLPFTVYFGCPVWLPHVFAHTHTHTRFTLPHTYVCAHAPHTRGWVAAHICTVVPAHTHTHGWFPHFGSHTPHTLVTPRAVYVYARLFTPFATTHHTLPLPHTRHSPHYIHTHTFTTHPLGCTHTHLPTFVLVILYPLHTHLLPLPGLHTLHFGYLPPRTFAAVRVCTRGLFSPHIYYATLHYTPSPPHHAHALPFATTRWTLGYAYTLVCVYRLFHTHTAAYIFAFPLVYAGSFRSAF